MTGSIARPLAALASLLALTLASRSGAQELPTGSSQPPAAPAPSPAPLPELPPPPPAAGSPAVVSAAAREPEQPASPRKPLGVFAGFGGRYQWMSSGGYDPFSTNDFMTSFDLHAGLVVLSRGKLQLAVTGGWDVGGHTDRARLQSASLALHRLWLGPEGRFVPVPWLFFFGRLAPQAIHARASVSDGGSPGPLLSRTWGWGLDALAGASLEMFNTGPSEGPYVRFWVSLEGGYAFAGTTEVVARPELKDDPRDYGAVHLPDLQPSGPLMRLTVSASF